MKRISFSAVLTALSLLVASGSAVAQDFPSTGHGSFNDLAVAAQPGPTALPPLPGQLTQSATGTSAVQVPAVQVPATQAPAQMAASQVAAAAQAITVGPAASTAPANAPMIPQTIGTQGPAVSAPAAKTQAAHPQASSQPQATFVPAPVQQQAPAAHAPAAMPTIGAYAPAVQVPAAAYAPSTAQPHGAYAPPAQAPAVYAPPVAQAPAISTTPSGPIYVERSTAHGEVFSSPAATQQYAPAPQVFAPAPAIQQAAVAPQRYTSVVQSPVQSTAVQDSVQVNTVPAQAFVIDESELLQGSAVNARPNRMIQRPKRGCNLHSQANGSVYSTIGVSAMLFDRSLGSNRDFSTNAGGDLLSSSNASNDVLAGVDTVLTRRRAAGYGWEARYFGFAPDDESIQVGNNATHLLPGFNQIGTTIFGTGPTAYVVAPSTGDLVDRADTHVLTRQTELNNIEFNMLKCTAPRFRAASTELLLGFRYFQFGETLLHEALNVPAGDATFVGPDSIGYSSSVENSLVGLQIGARSDYQIRGRLMMHIGLKAGAFNNRVNTRQRVDYRMPDGSIVNPTVGGGVLSGQTFDIGAENDVKSILGELDLAMSYQLSQSSRLRVGYRALAITDIAFASDQIQDDFTNDAYFKRANTGGNLDVKGVYLGLELAY